MTRKYERCMDIEPNPWNGSRRIRALINLPLHKVKAGDMGGWVADTAYLAQEGQCWVETGGAILGKGRVSSDALVGRDCRVKENAELVGTSILKEGVTLQGSCEVVNSKLTGPIYIGYQARVHHSTFKGSITVSHEAEVEHSVIKLRIKDGSVGIAGNSVVRRAHIRNSDDVVWFSNVGSDSGGTLTVFRGKEGLPLFTRG